MAKDSNTALAKKNEDYAARVFVYNGSELEDPGAEHDDKAVKEMYAAAYPELTTATLSIGFETRGDVRTKVVTFKKAAGTKG